MSTSPELMIPLIALDRTIAYNRAFRTITKSTVAALFLSQAWHWTRTLTHSREGWFYKTQAEWEDETGLTRREQETARKQLRELELIEEERRGLDPTLWFRVNIPKLASQIRDAYLSSANVAFVHQAVHESDISRSANPTSSLYTEMTTEKTSIESERDERSPQATSRTKRTTLIPDDWTPNALTLAWAEQEGYTSDEITRESAKFVNHYAATGKRMIDWQRAFQTWMARSREFNGGRSNGGTTSSLPSDQRNRQLLDEMRRKRREQQRDDVVDVDGEIRR